jgi:hypothetical protein
MERFPVRVARAVYCGSCTTTCAADARTGAIWHVIADASGSSFNMLSHSFRPVRPKTPVVVGCFVHSQAIEAQRLCSKLGWLGRCGRSDSPTLPAPLTTLLPPLPLPLPPSFTPRKGEFASASSVPWLPPLIAITSRWTKAFLGASVYVRFVRTQPQSGYSEDGVGNIRC